MAPKRRFIAQGVDFPALGSELLELPASAVRPLPVEEFSGISLHGAGRASGITSVAFALLSS